MEEPEKMVALKRAYAEIILNTTKESAARVLIADRRTAAAQQAVAAAKDEAVATLCRLKTIMDVKMKEAEKNSLGQARRIEELEIQLAEANDTITALKMEVEKVTSELEKMKSSLIEPLIRNVVNDYTVLHSGNGTDQNSDDTSGSPMRLDLELGPEHAVLNQRLYYGNCCLCGGETKPEDLNALSPENESGSNPDLLSIIMRRKQPDLYRNGCTQRIRAFKGTALSGKVVLEKGNNRFLGLKDKVKLVQKGTDVLPCKKEPSMGSVLEIQTEYGPESNPLFQLANICGDGQVRFPQGISSTKVARCSGKGRMDNQGLYGRNCSNASGKFRTESGCSQSRHVSGEYLITSTSPAQLKASSEDRERKKKLSPRNELVWPLRTKKRTRVCCKREMQPKSCNEDSKRSLPGNGNRDCKMTVSNPNSAKDFPNIAAQRRVKTPQIVGLEVHEPVLNSAESLEVLDSKIKHKNSDLPFTDADTKDENTCQLSEASEHASGCKYLKYTFERKRKRGLSHIHSGSLLEQNAIKPTVDSQTTLPETRKPTFLQESSRDNRRMVQVARQLISLSESRW